jgi:hypothetical protein
MLLDGIIAEYMELESVVPVDRYQEIYSFDIRRLKTRKRILQCPYHIHNHGNSELCRRMEKILRKGKKMFGPLLYLDPD